LVAGIVLAGGLSGPGISRASRLPSEIVERQSALAQLSAIVQVIERITAAQERTYRVEVHFESPEYLALQVEQTSGPSGWSANDSKLLIDGTTMLAVEPFPCPQLGGCVESPPRAIRVTGRDPFSQLNHAPLDVVIPTSVLKGAQAPSPLPDRVVAGRAAVGFEVIAAQARPLLHGYLEYGTWREVHDTDLVSIWVDAEYLTPLLVEVIAAPSADRDIWAARRGYEDGPEPYLSIEYQSVSFTAAPRPDIVIPTEVTESEGGFRPSDLAPPIELDMPLVSAGHLDGSLVSDLWAWSDGRAFLRLVQTGDWTGPGLFGSGGTPVEKIATEAGPVYLAGDDSAVFIHGDGYDTVITGSVAADELVAAAAALPGPHRPIPETWPEAPAIDTSGRRFYIPTGNPGFGDPIVHVGRRVITIDMFGGGSRWVRITQRDGDRISPPLDPDARAIDLRGLVARYSPTLGSLEWVEDGILFVVEAPGLSDAISIAESLTPSE
jgi:hypothetical protein